MQLLKFEESEPSTYPSLNVYWDEGTESESIAPVRVIWQRLEKYIVCRWTPRQCVWTVRGPGEWVPHLKPASNLTVDKWDETTYTWTAASPAQSPLGGFCFSERATYRVTGTVGDTADDVPLCVVEAYQRLQSYYEEIKKQEAPAGSASYSLNLAEGLNEEITRSPNWIAKALQNSGAADLLRPYRMV